MLIRIFIAFVLRNAVAVTMNAPKFGNSALYNLSSRTAVCQLTQHIYRVRIEVDRDQPATDRSLPLMILRYPRGRRHRASLCI
jgi:hypothetical protein